MRHAREPDLSRQDRERAMKRVSSYQESEVRAVRAGAAAATAAAAPGGYTGCGFDTSGARRAPATGAAQRTPLASTRRTCGWKYTGYSWSPGEK